MSLVRPTLTTEEMAKALGISTRTLLKLKAKAQSPFKLGEHFRFRGLTTKAPVQWFPQETDKAFTCYQAEYINQIETIDNLDWHEISR